MLKIASFFLIFAFDVCLAQNVESYFPLSGSRSTQQQINKNELAVQQLEFDPKVWPEVTFKQKEQPLLPLMKKVKYWNIQLPVFDHFEKKMRPFGFKFFPSKKYNAQTTRLVIIYPTIEGESIVEGNLARMAMSEGHHVLIAPIFDFEYKSGADGIADIREKTLFGVKAVKTFFDFLEYCYRNSDHPDQQAVKILGNVRPEQILQVGVSNGTVGTYIVSQTDKRVSQQLLIVPIGNIPGVFATTTNEKISKFRTEQMAYYGMTEQSQFANLVKKILQYDPMDFVDTHQPPQTLAFFQKDDATVPGRFQLEFLSRISAIVVSQELDITQVSFDSSLRMLESLKKQGLTDDTLKSMVNEISRFGEYQKNRVLRAIDTQQKRDVLFYELGFGHIKKILSIVFVFNAEIKKFFTLPKKFPSEWAKEDDLFYLRSFPLKSSGRIACKNAVEN